MKIPVTVNFHILISDNSYYNYEEVQLWLVAYSQLTTLNFSFCPKNIILLICMNYLYIVLCRCHFTDIKYRVANHNLLGIISMATSPSSAGSKIELIAIV